VLKKRFQTVYQSNIIGTVLLRKHVGKRILTAHCFPQHCECFYLVANKNSFVTRCQPVRHS